MANIVILEDEEKTLRALHNVANKLGHSVSSFYDPEAAIEAIESQKTDLLISDWDLKAPLTGISVANHTLALYPDSRIILITGNDMRLLKRQTYKMPNTIYMAKPFSVAAIREALQLSIAYD